MALEEPDVDTVFSLLRDSLNAGQTLRGPAVNPLSGYESRPGFFSRLMDIITAEGPPSDDDVRLSALNYFKEAFMSYWKNNRSFISGYEKKNLRNKLLSHLLEENDQKIAQTLAKIISLIARFDYPREWPELFSVLTKQLEKGDVLTSHSILEVLFHTLAILPRKDLQPEISSLLFDCCWKLWKKDEGIVYYNLTFYNPIIKDTSVGQQQDLTFGRWSLCLSIIQMLIISGLRGDAKFVKVPPVNEVCREFIGVVEFLVPLYSIFPDHPKLNSIHKICGKVMKGLVEIQKWYLTTFGDETVCDYIVKICLDTITSSTHEKSPLFEQILIECVVILKSILYCIRNQVMYDLPTFDGKKVITRVWKRNIPTVVEFLPSLPSDRVKNLCEILITRYFPLTKNDLKEWAQDPERFYLETNPYQQLDRIAKLRPHAEALFVEVFINYKRLLGPVVISILHEATKGRPANVEDSLPERFVREAAYTAVAHVYKLFDQLDLKKLFEEVLHPELRIDHPNMRIIQRKIAFIVETWASEVEGDMRKKVFCALLELLEYDDLVVRLAAIEPLQYIVATFDFKEEDLMDLLPSYWRLCFKLLKEVLHFHLKNFVLDGILSGIINIGEKLQKNSGITKIGQMIFPFANQLAYEIEKACEVSIENIGLQIKVLQALHCLRELEILSPVCYKILRPILEMLSVLKDNDRLILLTYAMQLWESMISNALSIDSQLLELFPYLQEVMKNSLDYYPRAMHHINDHSQIAIKIIGGYIKLGGGRFLSEHASVIHKLLVGIYGNLDFKPKKVGGLGEMDTRVFNFGASFADRVEAQKGELDSGRLKDTKTSVEEHEDEKNIGALDEIKEKHGCSSTSEFSMVRVIQTLFQDCRKLEEISLRILSPACQSFSAAVEDLGETLQHAFIIWHAAFF